ncbi:MAG: C-type lectin domain-containing protein, partial [Verrucomicrobiota bacterium]
MAFTLISPQGKRILLFENRGAETADLGNVVITTNTVGTVTNGVADASTNVISTGGATSGILLVNFDFQVQPDTLDVYYDGTNIFSSGLINGKGDLTIPFGPGTATELTIVINKNNNPGNPNTVWEYTPQIITQTGSYFRFSENTNFTQVPIKFAVPPFYTDTNGTVTVPTNVVIVSGPIFNPANNHDYYVLGPNTWPNSEAWAVSLGGHLATINDAAENGWVYTNVISLDPNRNAWIGLTAPSVNGPWSWASGEPVTYTNWAAGEPNTVGGAPYGVNYYPPNSPVGKTPSTWNNAPYSDSVQGIAEVPAAGTNLSYYFPEETLQSLVGDNAKGEWKLEMWDNRAGMTNAQMMSWQLRFVFEDEVLPAKRLVHGVPSTNTVAPCNMAYFLVDVPLWANFATNTLLFSTSPVNVYFSTNGLPTTNDVPQLAGVTNGFLTLSTNSSPPITPGSRYYIAVENPCGSPTNATFAIQVEFDVTTLENGVAVAGTNDGNTLPRYFVYDVSTNATAVSFQLTNMTGNFDLVARQGAPLPTTGSYDYGSFNAGTQDESIIVFTNSSPVALAPGRWYLGVFTSSVIPAGYTIVATEYTNAFPNIITLENGIPYTNSATAGGSDYYRYVVSGTGVRAQFEINSPTDDLTLVLRKGLPLPSITSYDYLSANAFTNDELIVLFTNSAPVPLTPGDWFLTAVNISGVPVNYSIKATEWASTGRPVNVTNSVYNPPTSTNVGSGSFCITWVSLPGVHYYVEGVPDLSSTNWTAVSPTLTADDYTTSYCVDLPSIYHFFRVVEGVTLSTFAPAPALSATWNGSAFVLEWSGAVGAQYQVEYSSSLSSPTWTAFASPVTTTTGVFTFTDDGSQTGGFGTQRFYRIVLLP